MSNRRWPLILLLTVAVAVALFCAIYPMYVIRPFRPQGPAELQAALAVMRVRPALPLLCAAVALFAAFRLWSPAPWTKRLALSAAALLPSLAAAACFVNVFEIMFHPIAAVAAEPASAAKLDDDEKVLAIRLPNGAPAHAYPIRAIAYHHVVNDSVGSVPIVATY